VKVCLYIDSLVPHMCFVALIICCGGVEYDSDVFFFLIPRLKHMGMLEGLGLQYLMNFYTMTKV
jgi:hypothetical protein